MDCNEWGKTREIASSHRMLKLLNADISAKWRMAVLHPTTQYIAIFSRVRTQVTVGRQSRWELGERGKPGEKYNRYAHIRSDCPNLTEYRYRYRSQKNDESLFSWCLLDRL